jgi:hypothetical protein
VNPVEDNKAPINDNVNSDIIKDGPIKNDPSSELLSDWDDLGKVDKEAASSSKQSAISQVKHQQHQQHKSLKLNRSQSIGNGQRGGKDRKRNTSNKSS